MVVLAVVPRGVHFGTSPPLPIVWPRPKHAAPDPPVSTSYIKKVHERYTLERDRAATCLHPTTREPLMRLVRGKLTAPVRPSVAYQMAHCHGDQMGRVLVDDHTEAFQREFEPMLAQGLVDG